MPKVGFHEPAGHGESSVHAQKFSGMPQMWPILQKVRRMQSHDMHIMSDSFLLSMLEGMEPERAGSYLWVYPAQQLSVE
jgi:hypothetical protein